jgi:hypothetical protein
VTQGAAAAVRRPLLNRSVITLALLTAVGLGIAPAARAQGLVAAYGFNEGTGTTTTDVSGNANNGSLSNTTWTTLGQFGNALSFNGTSSRVNVSDSGSLDLTTGMTLEAWVFPTSLTGTRTVVFKQVTGGHVYGLFASAGALRPVASVRIGATTFAVTGPSSLPLNAWSHLAATYDGSALRLYVNGADVASQAVAGLLQTSGNPLRLGGSASSGQYFQGRIDEVRVYSQARSGAEIQADMTAPVLNAPPTITVTSPADAATGVAPTANITATFSEAMTAATINTGTFQLRDPSATLVAAVVSYSVGSRTATLNPSANLANGVTYTATVVGGAGGVADSSGGVMASNATWAFTVRANTTTAVTSALNPSVFGQSVTFTATVTPAPPASGTPTGTIQFRVNGVNLGSPVPLAGGSATSPATTSLAAGNRTVTAVYSGDPNFNGSTSPNFTQVVNKAGTTPAIASSTSPTVSGQPVTFTATVTAVPPGAGTPSGTVQFRVDGVNLGSAVTLTGGSATSPTTTSLAVGNRAITAIYNGDTNFNTSTSPSLTQVVNKANTTTGVTASTNPTASGQPVTFTATVAAVAPGGGIPAGTVQFQVNGANLGSAVTLAGGSATSSATSSLAVGNHTVTAVYAGNTSFNGSTSPALIQVVNRANTTTSLTSSANPATVGQPVTFTATVAAVPPGAGTPAGTVQFQVDGANLGSAVTLAGGSATSPATSSLAVGNHTVTASYGGDVSFIASTAPSLAQSVTQSACTGNPIVVENCLPGNPSSEWDVSGAGDPSIQGFATDISVNRGDTVVFKIDATASYRLDVYRMGYYGGAGARRVTTISPVAAQNQPACLSDATTGLIDCGNWAVSASWTVPASVTSGIYFARAERLDTGGASHIFFVVRDDASTSDLLFQTSDTTWQAYNEYGGNSLYTGAPVGRAYKVSYNRPFTTRAVAGGQDWVFNAEYPMVRWLEANGYDVTYFTGVDADRRGSLILNHKAYLSVGHDEYWSGAQRANVEAARNAGIHLAFFSGNEIFWKTRWESSSDGTNTPYRTLVTYKETHANAVIDPADPPTWTGTWRDPRFSPPGDGGRPENALSGTIFMANDTGTPYAITVPEADGKMRFWRNTSVATLGPGQTATLPIGTLGYEWDSDLDNGHRPPGLIRMSTTAVTMGGALQDWGSSYGQGTVTHYLTLYRHGSGALVFGAGTIQWSWGLDANHDRGETPADARMRQATVNLLADMGVQAGTLQTGLVAAAASTDTTSPASTITAPADGTSVPTGSQVTITGTATDSGGGVVGGIEVSVDGGATWHPAAGRSSWTYNWTAPTSGATVTLRSRAVDDSGNLETPSAGVTITVGSGTTTCPCSMWSSGTTPTGPSDPDTSPVEIGVKFRTSVPGFVTGIRFYKGAGNVGPHVAHLWTSTGSLLASASFTNETAQGWQQVTLPTPIAINANTTYVASYHTASGRYAGDQSFFTTSMSAGPLTFLADGQDGPNGVYLYGGGGFPTQGFNASNYWVDVVFTTTSGGDASPPSVLSVSPANGSVGVDTGASVTATFNEPMDAATINGSTFLLKDSGNNPVPATVSYNASAWTVTLTPNSPLAFSTAFLATVKGGSTDPRVKDTAGSAMTSDFTWSFTTAGEPPIPPTQGPGGPVLVITAATNPFTTYYAEILRTEGLNLFHTADITTVTASTLAAHDVVVLGQMPLTAAQVTMLGAWVNGGGRLIALRPDKQLAGLLGLTDELSTLSEGYILIDTSKTPGAGLVSQTIQFHGTADLYTANVGTSTLATLYFNSTTSAGRPAATLRSVGSNGGQAAAFAYDLARSVVYTRQGNPAWAGQDRDSVPPIRSNDLFHGAAAGDVQPDWVDLAKVEIPQADEQQRLLANLILSMNQSRRPLPRFWYFPRGVEAVVVMTGDDHATGGTSGRFDAHLASSPAGCSVATWECVRSTSYVYPGTPMSAAQAAGYVAQGFEVALHVNTGCADWTPEALEGFYSDQLAVLAADFPSVPPAATNRTHCIAWSDWATQAQVELAHGIRLDTNYYYWPPGWVADRPGLFTGSGMPMRFAGSTGTMTDVYQAVTQMTDESGQSYPFTINALLDKAIGPEGYYGVFTANMHTDAGNAVAEAGSAAIVASAMARGIPVVSARQMLEWLDGRNGSYYANVIWNGSTLTFTVSVAAGANGLQAMVPIGPGQQVLGVISGGNPVPFVVAGVKGVNYAFFLATSGDYQVSFAQDTTPPVVTSTTPADGAPSVSPGTSVRADFSEPMDPVSIGTTTFELRNASNALVPATVSYDGTARAATLVPNSSLTIATTYAATVKAGVKDGAGNSMGTDVSWSFTTSGPGCPCGLWSSSTVPANLDSNDSSAVELGVKFRSDIAGRITAIRFYKGPNDTGSHIVNLWTVTGSLLVSVPAAGGTASGWQEVALPTPGVAISASTTYVASYHTTVGRYPFDGAYFATAGVDNGVLHAPSTGSGGGNGVYAYGAGGFPSSTFNATNYWVDVVFEP